MSSASNKSSPPSTVANVPASGGSATPAAAPAPGRSRPPVSQQRPQPPRAEQQKQQQQQRAPREGQPARDGRDSRESREAREAARAAREAEKAFRNPLPPITYPEDLPVSGRREEIAKALTENQVIIVSGETGSGKTTQLPKICLELGRGQKGLIGHTQPRRIAASSTAKRIAQELGTPLGETVGFKVRFADTLTKGASVKLMTDGILLAETQTDPLVEKLRHHHHR